jgi:hypothetical protein
VCKCATSKTHEGFVVTNIFILIYPTPRFEMTLNYQVMVQKYPFPNEVVGGSIPTVKSSLYLTRGGGLAR